MKCHNHKCKIKLLVQITYLIQQPTCFKRRDMQILNYVLKVKSNYVAKTVGQSQILYLALSYAIINAQLVCAVYTTGACFIQKALPLSISIGGPPTRWLSLGSDTVK